LEITKNPGSSGKYSANLANENQFLRFFFGFYKKNKSNAGQINVEIRVPKITRKARKIGLFFWFKMAKNP